MEEIRANRMRTLEEEKLYKMRWVEAARGIVVQGKIDGRDAEYMAVAQDILEKEVYNQYRGESDEANKKLIREQKNIGDKLYRIAYRNKIIAEMKDKPDGELFDLSEGDTGIQEEDVYPMFEPIGSETVFESDDDEDEWY